MTATAAIAGLARSGARPFVFVWDSWRALTARHFGYAAVVALLLGIVQGTGNAIMASGRHVWWRAFLSDLNDNLTLVIVLMLSLAVATRVRTRRLPRWLPFVAAASIPLIAGPVLSAINIQLLLLLGADLADWPGLTSPSLVGIWTHLPLSVVLSYMLVLGYMFAREAAQRADALRRVQLAGVRIARRAFESRLHALQARIEPQFLFDTLRQVEELYETDAALAERMLDDLIVYLRAALPKVDDPDSTVGTEAALARAWLDIRKVCMHGRLKVELDVPEDLQDARLPPMVLLPLLDRAGASVAGSPRPIESIAVAFAAADGRLRVCVSDSGRPHESTGADAAYAPIRARLAALYGDQASLAVSCDMFRGTTAIAEVPHERHPGNHR